MSEMRRKVETIGRFFQPPPTSFFLFGPRGTGKSSWIKAHLPDALVIDLLLPSEARRFAARPEDLLAVLRGAPESDTVVIDEVQRVPELLSVVHHAMEQGEGRRFVLTGSSARKLRVAGVDLLAGRAVKRSLHPFMAAELGAKFRLDEALKLGLLPLVRSSQDPAAATYADLYLHEEVKLEGLVRDVGAFARFLEAISFSHGGLLNLSAVSRECQVERKTVERYVEVLEDLLLAHRLPVFARRARRELVAHSRLYLFDAGVFRSLRPRGPLDRAEEIDGAALEGLVFQHLRAWRDYTGAGDLYFWRTRHGVEVDFVVYGEATFLAIDVKNTAQIRGEDLRGLNSFTQDYPEATLVLLYRGARRERHGNVWCLPVEEALRCLVPGQSPERCWVPEAGSETAS